MSTPLKSERTSFIFAFFKFRRGRLTFFQSLNLAQKWFSRLRTLLTVEWAICVETKFLRRTFFQIFHLTLIKIFTVLEDVSNKTFEDVFLLTSRIIHTWLSWKLKPKKYSGAIGSCWANLTIVVWNSIFVLVWNFPYNRLRSTQCRICTQNFHDYSNISYPYKACIHCPSFHIRPGRCNLVFLEQGSARQDSDKRQWLWQDLSCDKTR